MRTRQHHRRGTREPEPTGRGFLGGITARAGDPLGYLPLKRYRLLTLQEQADRGSAAAAEEREAEGDGGE